MKRTVQELGIIVVSSLQLLFFKKKKKTYLFVVYSSGSVLKGYSL